MTRGAPQGRPEHVDQKDTRFPSMTFFNGNRHDNLSSSNTRKLIHTEAKNYISPVSNTGKKRKFTVSTVIMSAALGWLLLADSMCDHGHDFVYILAPDKNF